MDQIRQLNQTRAVLFFLSSCLIILFAFSCCKCKNGNAESIDNKVEIPKDSLDFDNNIIRLLSAYIPLLPSVKDEKIKFLSWQEVVRDFYQQNNYKAIWVSKDVLTSKGKEMLYFLGTAEFSGLNKELYDYNNLQRIADSCTSMLPLVNYNLSKQLETGLTRSFFEMALHLNHGMFLDTVRGINTNFWSSKENYIQLLQSAQTVSVSEVMSSLEPDNPMYNRYMNALRTFVGKNNISSNPISIRNPKQDSIGAVDDARKALVYHHYLTDSLKNNDSVYILALKKFQKENNLNGDGVIGTYTVKALERDNSRKFQMLAINADRWRKEHIKELPEKYVWVNLPSFKVKIIEKDTVRLEKNIVIGKSNLKNETPILESAINQIVLWPTWTVPQSIIKNEMKSFKGYKVTRKGKYLTVVQPPGLRNALGCVKILFPNKYSVYMHDTPSKSLFNLDLRAASHGCVRCQDALEIAAYLMVKDTFQTSYDSLIALKDRKIETQIFKLQKPVAVYFRYFTAEPDFDGNIKFYADVYGRDKDMIKFIFNGKQPHVLTAAEKREKVVSDSLALVKKKKADSLSAESKLLIKKEKLLIPAVNDYLPIADTTSAKQDSL